MPINATTKSIPVIAQPLTTITDVGFMMEWAVQNQHWRASFSGSHDRTGAEVWTLQIVDADGATVTASYGDVYVWDNVKLVAISQADFDTKYTVV